jgi:hypothetical protein
MHEQIDRFEDNGRAMLLPYPGDGRSFKVPRVMLQEAVSAKVVCEARFEHDRGETEPIVREDRRSLGDER